MYPPQAVKKAWQRVQGQPKRLLHWYVLGTKATPPPDLFKQRLVKQLQKQFGLHTFVETGTYKGDMTAAARSVFDQVYSIELHRPFYDKALERFRGDDGVQILFGDSTTKLRELLTKINEPALFWLDAHGGKSARLPDGSEGPAPVRAEVEAILVHKHADRHVILVDDVHTFVRGTKWGVGVWAQVEELRQQWLAKHPEWIWKVKDNVLRVYKAPHLPHPTPSKKYPVWQLMDGTVVVQGKDVPFDKLRVNPPNLVMRVKHWVYKILDKI